MQKIEFVPKFNFLTVENRRLSWSWLNFSASEILSAYWAQYLVRLCRKVKETIIHSCAQAAYGLVAKINNIREALGEQPRRARKGQRKEEGCLRLLWEIQAPSEHS